MSFKADSNIAESFLESPRFSTSFSPENSTQNLSSPSSTRFNDHRAASIKSNSFSSPLTQASAPTPKHDLFGRTYAHSKLIHDVPSCKSPPHSASPIISGHSSSEKVNDGMEDSVTKLHKLITSYYSTKEVKDFKWSDAHAILDKLLTNKISLTSALGQLNSENCSKIEKKDSSSVYQSEDFKELVSEFERIYSSALKSRQLHNESLQKEEELEDKLLFTQLKYDSIMKGSGDNQETP